MFPTNPRQVSRLSENTWAREHAANETEAGPHHLIKTSCGGRLDKEDTWNSSNVWKLFCSISSICKVQKNHHSFYHSESLILLSTAVGWRIDPSLVAPCESVCECAVCVLSQYCCVCVALQAARSRGSCELKGRDRLAPSPGKCTEQEERVWLKASFGKTDSAGELYIFTTPWQLVMGDC